ncbi:MAG: OmpA family protein [Betaproteobacteria bacterium]|nr:OmpA family protein [Betaproteobacteria bacterium]
MSHISHKPTSHIRFRFLLAICVLLAASNCVPSAAATEPSVDEMVDALVAKQAPGTASGIRMRSLGSKPAAPAAPATGQLNLSVQFEFASAKISAESRELLARLGSAMNAPALAGRRFRIEGHTDAVGDPQVNLRLSEQRAQNVKQFLVSNAGVNVARLAAIGKGSSDPRDSANPHAMVNRRVVVVALDDSVSIGSASQPSQAIDSPAGPKTGSVKAGAVQRLQGEVSVTRANKSIAIGSGDALREGDTISTAAGATVVVQLDDGAKLLVRPGTKVILTRVENAGAFDKLNHSIELVIGAIRYVTGLVGKSRPDAVRFKTPVATIGIRGTDFDIVHAPEANSARELGTYVRVNTGGIELAGSDGSKVSLAMNEQAFAAPQGPKLRGGGRAPAAIKLEAPASVFASGELDSLLEAR